MPWAFLLFFPWLMRVTYMDCLSLTVNLVHLLRGQMWNPTLAMAGIPWVFYNLGHYKQSTTVNIIILIYVESSFSFLLLGERRKLHFLLQRGDKGGPGVLLFFNGSVCAKKRITQNKLNKFTCRNSHLKITYNPKGAEAETREMKWVPDHPEPQSWDPISSKEK